ncbi:Golgi-to-ER vesicle coat component [Spiromyces aspiralis]|uniref:Golgi-to-ER vesicle coat component n=1 Tax=Spiromyces aspiralis TaxID=68401 RepID=A0ACC1HM70_9FUNG|nr:Golgi-to-ER vesicle coat component [Spiromyces aspiralis]
MNLSLYSVHAALVLDKDGNHIFTKYYSRKDFPALFGGSRKEQAKFESGLASKTVKSHAEVIMYDGYVVCYKNISDVCFYFVGRPDENELILSIALNAFVEAVSILLNDVVDKRNIFDKLDMVMLALDETIDDGIILETSAPIIAERVSKRPSKNMDMDISNINEQTLKEASKQATEWFRSFISA